MANSALSVANTDFASIRADLKTYLGAQGNFKDYNFDGTYEFDDDSLVNSLAMIGSGGGFITIEPRRSIIKSPSEHTVLFDYESIVLESERVKVDGQSSINHPLVQNPSVRESSNDPENTQLDQPSKTSEGAKMQQSTDPVEAQSKAITPLPEVPVSEEVIDGPIDKPVSDTTHDTSINVEGEFDEKMSFGTSFDPSEWA